MTGVEFEVWTPEAGEAAPEASGRKPVMIGWASKALEPRAPVEYIIDKLAPAGSVSIWAGDPGAKKTWSLIDACVAVADASRDNWMGLAVTHTTALLVDEESGEERLLSRLEDIMRAQSAPAGIPLAYTSLHMFNLRTPDSVADLDDTMRTTGARLVVVDALADIMAGGDENTVRDTQPVFQVLRQLAMKYRAAIIIIHHAGKNGDYRGSSAIKGAVDWLVKVSSEKGSRVIHFEVEKSRDVEEFKFAANIVFEPGQVLLTPASSEATKKLAKSHVYALRYMYEHGPSLLTDIMAKPDTCTSETARQAVYALAGEMLAGRTDSGGKGVAAVYALTPAGQARAAAEFGAKP
jgi:hypothetical protein